MSMKVRRTSSPSGLEQRIKGVKEELLEDNEEDLFTTSISAPGVKVKAEISGNSHKPSKNESRRRGRGGNKVHNDQQLGEEELAADATKSIRGDSPFTSIDSNVLDQSQGTKRSAPSGEYTTRNSTFLAATFPSLYESLRWLEILGKLESLLLRHTTIWHECLGGDMGLGEVNNITVSRVATSRDDSLEEDGMKENIYLDISSRAPFTENEDIVGLLYGENTHEKDRWDYKGEADEIVIDPNDKLSSCVSSNFDGGKILAQMDSVVDRVGILEDYFQKRYQRGRRRRIRTYAIEDDGSIEGIVTSTTTTTNARSSPIPPLSRSRLAPALQVGSLIPLPSLKKKSNANRIQVKLVQRASAVINNARVNGRRSKLQTSIPNDLININSDAQKESESRSGRGIDDGYTASSATDSPPIIAQTSTCDRNLRRDIFANRVTALTTPALDKTAALTKSAPPVVTPEKLVGDDLSLKSPSYGLSSPSTVASTAGSSPPIAGAVEPMLMSSSSPIPSVKGKGSNIRGVMAGKRLPPEMPLSAHYATLGADRRCNEKQQQTFYRPRAPSDSPPRRPAPRASNSNFNRLMCTTSGGNGASSRSSNNSRRVHMLKCEENTEGGPAQYSQSKGHNGERSSFGGERLSSSGGQRYT